MIFRRKKTEFIKWDNRVVKRDSIISISHNEKRLHILLKDCSAHIMFEYSDEDLVKEAFVCLRDELLMK